MAKKSQKASQTQARQTIGAEALPRRTLRDCVAIAEALHKTYAGKSASWDEISDTLSIGKKTNATKYLFWSAQAYGLINKEVANQYTLSETGRKIVAPTYDVEDKEAIRKAIVTPTILSKFFSDYAGHPLPGAAHLPNVLETRYGIPRDRIDEATNVILDNARHAGILHDRPDGSQSIDLALPSQVPSASASPESGDAGLPAAPPVQGGAPTTDWSTVCFYITPIGQDGSDERKHADMMQKHLVEPAAKEHGLQVVRADKIGRSGLITQQVFEHLAKARLCVADLSFNNPNAFYELGVRHVCKLATIQIIRKGDKIPFDVSQGRTINVDTADVYTIMDRVESARRELSEHIKNIMAAPKDSPSEDNPVHVYLPTLQVTLPAKV